MTSTRQSARLSSSPQAVKDISGTKRKAEESSPSGDKTKRSRPSKDQKTLEETMPDVEAERKDDAVETGTRSTEATERAEKPGADANGHMEKPNADAKEAEIKSNEQKTDEPKIDEPREADARPEGVLSEKSKANGAVEEATAKSEESSSKEEINGNASASKTDGAVEEDKEREKTMPSNVLEKGIVYFFARGRVGVDDPDSVQDLARSYFVLRPIPDGAKLTDGAIQDGGNNRLIALPKKVWPKSGKDRFMAFVEKAETPMATLKEEFFAGSEYTTKTVGVRSMPEVTPLGEGVYALTTTGGGQGTTHLVYMLTIPSEIGEVQKDVGIADKGSFVLSLKNPEKSGPANAQLDQKPEYPREFIEEFRDRAWMPLMPKHLNYANAQMLLIGEDFDSSSNLEPAPKDEKDDKKETPQEEIEKLEHEDELRVERLKGDDTIFDDLRISKDEYQLMTTW